jgi:4-diphosphocytidyl-2-C-methyl-D-erythritol kinase
MKMAKHTYFAPAKINRFLHIVGRRSDGYHELQTIFQRINYGDILQFNVRKDGEITLEIQQDAAILKPQALSSSLDSNSVLQAASSLQSLMTTKQGVDITLTKKIPVGAGLGGGSSDAATTLMALNQLWNLNLSKKKLIEIGLPLGADIPFFILEQSAWGEGVGEKLTPIILPKSWFLVVVPQCSISTIEVFKDPSLKRDTPLQPLDLQSISLLIQNNHNDCAPVARRLYPEVNQVIETLSEFVKPRMTGTGSCVFAVFERELATEAIQPLSLNYSPQVFKNRTGLLRFALKDDYIVLFLKNL